MTDEDKPPDPSGGSEIFQRHLAPSPGDWTQILGSFRRKLQRYPTSYEEDLDGYLFLNHNIIRAKMMPTTSNDACELAVRHNLSSSDNFVKDSKKNFLSEPDSTAQDKPNENKNESGNTMPTTDLSLPSASGVTTPITKRSPRHGPSLTRLQRIESEMFPEPGEKIIRVNSVKIPTQPFEHQSSGNAELGGIRRTGSSVGSESTSQLKKVPQVISPESTTAKDNNSKNWIARSVSKIIPDKQTSSTASEKKRSKSPSGLLEFAQRRLPKWASFIKKSDDENHPRPESSNSTKQTIKHETTPEKLKSSDATPSIASTSESQNKEVESKDKKQGECRWFVSGDDQNQSKSEFSTYGQGHKLTKANSFEPKCQSAEETFQPTTKSYSFSLFKGKEYRESGKEGKQKGKSIKGSQSTTSKSKKHSEQSNALKTSSDGLHVEQENRSKSVSPVEIKPSAMKEKSKYFLKQKSKDKSTEPVRKNSITFGNLREKYNNWSKGSCSSSRDKAASTENVEGGRLESLAGRSQGEFLVASMRIFLVVSPPATRSQVRSRSLNNLDSVEAHGSRLAVPPAPELALARKINSRFFSSMPELNAINYTRDIPYSIGATKGKSAFVRCSKNQLRHTYSQGSPSDFFKLSLPNVVDNSLSVDESTPNPRKHFDNSVYVPALGGTSLRNAAQFGSTCGQLMSDSSTNIGSDYTATLNESGTPLPLDSTDAALLAGKTVTLQPKQQKTTFIQKALGKAVASRMFSTSTDESYGRWRSGGAGGSDGRASADLDSWPVEKHEIKYTGFSHKINQTWTSIFGTKADPGKMEKLAKKLNDMTEQGVPLLPGFKREPLGEAARKALYFISDTKLEWIFDITCLSVKEMKRQRVIMELITTEASFIGYMRTVVELFYSVAYELQQDGILTDVDNKKIFYNIPDILNVNIAFWGNTIYPMLEDAINKKQRFNTQFLYKGFYSFRDNFHPYELYVQEQKKIQKYSKEKMETCEIYNAFLKWCESQKECKRLKLSDILVKPMQRLTKYTLLLNAIYMLTDYEPEKRTMKTMYRNTKRYIYEINTAIRYKEESEVLARIVESIESYDAVEVRDEEIDRLLKRHYSLDLKGQMVGCDPMHRRTLILEGDIKFKDHRDLEVRGFLLTDMLLIAIISRKKKGNQPATYKIIRQKYMVDKIRVYPQYHTRDGVTEMTSLVCIVVDETGTATGYFTISEISSPKEGNPTLKKWEFAIREAQATLELARTLYRQPREDYWTDTDSLSDNETDRRDETMTPDQLALERAAKRRVATMVHGAAMSLDTDNTEGGASAGAARGRGISRASSRASRLSSLQQSYSGSYEISEWAAPRRGCGSADTSTDRRTTSVSSDESVPPPLSLPPTEYQHTVDMVNKMRSRSPSQRGQRQVTPPRIASDVHAQCMNSAMAICLQHANVGLTSNTLTVQSPHGMSIMQSLPNLTSGQISPAIITTAPQVSLNVPQGVPRNRQIYVRTGLPTGALTPDSRGTSYPPPSPTRASLRRGFAFSSTMKNPPLSKTKHVSREPVYSSYMFTPIPCKNDTKGINKGASTSRGTGSSSPLEVINVNVRGPNFLNIPSGSPGEYETDDILREVQQLPQLKLQLEQPPRETPQQLPEAQLQEQPEQPQPDQAQSEQLEQPQQPLQPQQPQQPE